MVEVSSDEEMENEDPRALRSPLWRRRTKKTTNESKRPPRRRRRRRTTTRCGTWAVPRRSPTRRRATQKRTPTRTTPPPPTTTTRLFLRWTTTTTTWRLNEATGVVRSNHSWTGPLPEIGCPKCRFAAKGCGRCRAIRATPSLAPPLPWGGTVRVRHERPRTRTKRARPTPAPRSASAKKRKGRSAPAASVRRVRFDDDAPGGRLTSIVPASAGKRRRLLAPAPGSSGKRRGRPPSFEKKRPVAVSMTFPRRPPCFLG